MRILKAIVQRIFDNDGYVEGQYKDLEGVDGLDEAALRLSLTIAYPPGEAIEKWLQLEIIDIQGYLNAFYLEQEEAPKFAWGEKLEMGKGTITVLATKGEMIHIELCLFSDSNELLLENQRKRGFES